MRTSLYLLLLILLPFSHLSAQDAAPTANPACRDFMNRKQQFVDSQKQMDLELKNKLDKMNGEKGEQKISMMAAIINDLVNQRIAMHEHMAKMRENKAAIKERCPMMHGSMDMMRGQGQGKNATK